MKKDLVRLGTKADDIICDYAGLLIRWSALSWFSAKKRIVVSQKFHNTRTVYIGRPYGIELYGYNAQDVALSGGVQDTAAGDLF